MALHDELTRDFQNRQRRQPQKVKLHQTDLFHVILVEHGHRRVTAGLLVQRTKICQLARRNHHATRVHADVARHTLQLLCQLNQVLDVFFLLNPLRQ